MTLDLDLTDPQPAGETPGPLAFSKPDIRREDIDAVIEVLETGWITTGSVSELLEARLADRLGVEHVIAVSSCTAALEIALASLQLPKGSLVGIPTWTFVSTALAAMHVGLRPVLLDVDPDTLNVTVDEVERAIALGVEAIVPVHFGGLAVDSGVRAVAAANRVAVVEDAAHALGTTDERGPAAGQGSVGACLSFYATKNLTSAEGGALVTNDPAVDRFARSYRLHGMSVDAWARYLPGGRRSYDVDMVGIKANMPDVLAAIALSQLARFDESQDQRAKLVGAYRQQLDALDIHCFPRHDRPGNAHHLMVIQVPDHVDRDELSGQLSSEGISTSVHFTPVHRLSVAGRNCLAPASGFPVAEHLADRVLSLPLGASMEEDDVERVCDALRRFC